MCPGLPKSGSDERRSQPQAYYHVLKMLQSEYTITTQATIRGQVYLVPFNVPQRMTLNKLFMLFTTPSGTARFAIYKDAGDTPATGTKVYDSGNIGIATTTQATVTYLADPGQYWLATTCATNAAVIQRGNGNVWIPFCSASFSYASNFSLSNETRSTALPTTCPTVSIPVVSNLIAYLTVT